MQEVARLVGRWRQLGAGGFSLPSSTPTKLYTELARIRVRKKEERKLEVKHMSKTEGKEDTLSGSTCHYVERNALHFPRRDYLSLALPSASSDWG